MAYVVFARKYRPQSLDQVIGQEHISRTLKNAIAENRVAHAYLFSGPRGVGKTTTARILAKALNCQKGPTSEPCGTCANCTEITAGSSIDVQEIDGASNRGIDEIRALRDNVKFAAASSKYKIYIIDEAHQITDAAFNALLKTLEEPPSHVVFILATTEPQKIPVTILSRCQRYRFRLLSSKEIMGTLSKIVENEGFQVEPAALQIITTTSGGSMRDALSLLDQALSFGTGKVTAEDMQNLLGFLPKDIINATVKALAAEDMAELLSRVKEVTEQGYNLLQFARDLRDHLRYILLNKVNPEILEIPDEEKKLLDSQKELFSVAWLTRSGHLLSKALDEMRWSDQPRLVMELYLLKLAQPFAGVKDLMDRLEKLEKNLPAGDREPAPARNRTAAQKPAAAVEFNAAPAPEPADVELDEPLPEFSEAASAPTPVAGGDPGIAAVWAGVVGEMQHSRPIIGSMLAGVGLKGFSGNNVTVAVTNTFQQEGLKRNQSHIEELLTKKLGKNIGLKIIVEEKSASQVEEKDEIVVDEETPPAAGQPVYKVEGSLSDSGNNVPPGLEKIMNKFPGRVTKKNN